MQCPVGVMVTILIPMWKNSKSKLPGKEWTYLKNKEENWSVRFKMEDIHPITTVIMHRVKHAVYKGTIIRNPFLETIQNGGLTLFDIKKLYNQRSGFQVNFIGAT